MENWLKVCILVVIAASTTGNEEVSPAKLLFSKQILNKYLVEGMDIVIKYVYPILNFFLMIGLLFSTKS